VGGWHFGHSLRDARPTSAPSFKTSAEARTSPRKPSKPVFAAESPHALWIERVKAAKAGDFPQLAEDWNALFPEDERYEEFRAPNAFHALRWMMGMWLVNDPEGFLEAVSGELLDTDYWAAQAVVELMPEKAVDWLTDQDRHELRRFFLGCLASELAKSHPERYLKINPDGTAELGLDGSHHDWEAAITSLAKTDALAAANACLRWKVENAPRTIHRALLAVAAAWKAGDPDFLNWAAGITDPKLRNFAKHAWLSVLAEMDPVLALQALHQTDLEQDNDIGHHAQISILKQLAMTDPVAALRLMKEAEYFFASAPSDYFQAIPKDANAGHPMNPFRHLFANNPLDQNSMRHAVLNVLVEKLPDDPAGLLAAIRMLNGGIADGDAAWQRGVEAHLIRLKSARWSAEDCFEAAARWAGETRATDEDATLRQLATRAARHDPEQAFSMLESFPEQARSYLLGEIIKRLPPSDTERRIELLGQLPVAMWDREMGETLGRSGANYAPIIAALSTGPSADVLDAFTRQWGEQDPEAVVDWLESLPDTAQQQTAARGLAAGWVQYDIDATAAWADALPDGIVRDAAADRISYWLSMGHSEDAWQWADTIADAQLRAKAYGQVAIYWRADVPGEFRAAHDNARQEAGLPPYDNHNRNAGEDPFR